MIGPPVERNMTRLQAGDNSFKRRDCKSVSSHERQIGDCELREKPGEGHRRDKLHPAAVELDGRAELISVRIAIEQSPEALSRLLHIRLGDHDVQ